MPLRPILTAVLLCLLVAACGNEASPTATDGVPATAPPPEATAPTSQVAGAGGATATAAPPQPAEPSDAPAAPSPPAPAPATSRAGSCAAPEQLPIQGGEHLIGDNPPPVPYSSSPPTSGWHASGAFDVAVQPLDQPLSEPRHVSVLEAGGVVVSYNGLDEATRSALEQHVSAHFDGRVAVTAYEPLADGEVAFTAWGLLQRCDGLDLTALDAFANAHADADVATGHSH